MSSGGNYDDESAIGNFWTDTIYPRSFKDGSGKYLNVVVEDDESTSFDYYPPYPSKNRVKITIKFLKRENDIREVTIRKFKEYVSKGVPRWEEQRWSPSDPLTLTHLTFERLAAILKLITELDLANLNERRISLREARDGRLDPETLAKVQALLNLPDGEGIVEELLLNGSISSRDLVNIGYRRKQLQTFHRLLTVPDFAEAYRLDEGLSDPRLESVWQHFFELNQWIFGFGLDYRFLRLLQREAHVAVDDLAGRDGAITDFLMGAREFTVLVEVKTPNTSLFEARRNRAGAWKLSRDLVDSVSQILEQKASWQIRAETSSRNFGADGEPVTQSAIDPKCLLIIGSEAQFSGSARERAIKLRTFELFRRDSRNIEIVTYDELYERAQFLVEHGTPPMSSGGERHESA